MTAANADNPRLVILYDGVCGFCNRIVQFVLKRDRSRKFHFAPLQGEYAAELLSKYGKDPSDLDTVFLAIRPGTDSEALLQEGRATLRILRELGGIWWLVSGLGLLPTPVLNWGYQVVAKRRYRIFGKLDACPIPRPEDRARFL